MTVKDACHKRFRAVVIGGSAGGSEALVMILDVLPKDFALPLLLVQHLHPGDGGAFARRLADKTSLPVVEPCDKQIIERGTVYVAPAGYHMLVEAEETIALSMDEKVNWSRPSIDVLFESASRVWSDTLAAVILSGANTDGAEGIRIVKRRDGFTMAQRPETAQMPVMPQAAIGTGSVDEVSDPTAIGRRLAQLPIADHKWGTIRQAQILNDKPEIRK